MKPITAWTEIPVTDLDAAIGFYAEVFGWNMQLDTTGPNPMANFDSDIERVGGHLYPGKPAADGTTGPTIHLAVPDSVEAGAQRATRAGGSVIGPVIEIPPGRFQYVLGPDHKSIGLFEPRTAT